MKGYVEKYNLAKPGTEERSYEYLYAAVSNVIARERMDDNRAHRRGREYDLLARRSRTGT